MTAGQAAVKFDFRAEQITNPSKNGLLPGEWLRVDLSSEQIFITSLDSE